MKQSIRSKSKSPLPDFVAKNVEDIDFSYLKKQGVKACFFDLDHTILNQGTNLVSETILKQLRGLNIELYIATNRRYTDELRVISKQLHSRGIMHSAPKGIFKPRKAYYERLIALAGVAPENIVMVGDRIFQDIWGANRMGVRSVLVSKLGPIRWWDRITIIPDIVLPALFKGRYSNV